jgi:diguanylate cyclase (GGDEF)-like protein
MGDVLPVVRPRRARVGLFRAYVVLAGVVGAGSCLAAAIRLSVADVVAMGAPFALIAGLLLLGELRPVVTSSFDPQGVNISTAFVFAILVHWGPWPALLLQMAAMLLGEVARRRNVWRIVFNTGQYVACLAVAWLALSTVGGLHGSPTEPVAITAQHLPAMVLSWCVYFVVNLALVSGAISLNEGTRFWDEFRDDIGYYAVTTFAVLALSPVVAVVAVASWQLIPLLLLPLFLVYKTASISREKDHAAMHDALTGLANRKLLIERMREAGQDSLRSGRPVALCLLDLDRFKEVNDTLGHHTGDRLLEIAANRLLRAVRPEDTVARLGGDEFAVLVREVNDAGRALETARRVRDVLSEPFQLDDMTLSVEASVGVAMYPTHAGDVTRLLQLADVAMYQAKEDRTGVELYRPDKDVHTTDRLDLMGSVRRAIEQHELQMYFQPCVALPGGQPVGVEALVRWIHPERGMVMPDEFLTLVEQTGLMRQLTQEVLAGSLSRAAEWWGCGLHLPVAVNVSVRDLTDVGFAEVVDGLLRRYGLPSRALKLEITEHVLMADPARMTYALEALGRVGVELSLDDFGTGYSSLVHLKRLPVSEIKVDRSFVNRMTSDLDDAAIVRSIVDLGHALGLRVVAEGVETPDTWLALQAMRCDAAQGFLMSRPVPGAEITGWLSDRAGDVAAEPPWANAGPEGVLARP